MQLCIRKGFRHLKRDRRGEKLIFTAVEKTNRRRDPSQVSQLQVDHRVDVHLAKRRQQHLLKIAVVLMRIVQTGRRFEPAHPCSKVGGFQSRLVAGRRRVEAVGCADQQQRRRPQLLGDHQQLGQHAADAAASQMGARKPRTDQQIGQLGGHLPMVESRRGAARTAMARQIGQQNAVALVQGLEQSPPGRPSCTHKIVQQHQRRGCGRLHTRFQHLIGEETRRGDKFLRLNRHWTAHDRQLAALSTPPSPERPQRCRRW